jgi:hypothetical protein
MNGIGWERVVQALATSSARRHALRASLVGILTATVGRATQPAEAKKKKHKKHKRTTSPPPTVPTVPPSPPASPPPQCLQATQTCTSAASCCGAEFGVVACRQILVTKDTCATQFPGLRCCELDNVICDPNQGNCGCCDDLVCSLAADNTFRCQPSEP